MQTSSKIFDDLSRVASGAASAFSGLREEIDQMIRQRLQRIIADMDVVGREEFEAVRAIAIKAREEQEDLTDKVAELEKQIAVLQKTSTKKPATRKPTAKKPAAKPRAAAKKESPAGPATKG